MIHVGEEMGQVGRIRFTEASANVTSESCAFPRAVTRTLVSIVHVPVSMA